MNLKKSGFTLVELAIVIVIIGLLIGGVLAGKELVEQAKVRSLIKEFQGYEVSLTLFKDKYKCVPGDCVNASNVLTGAYNGDGDGMVEITLVGAPNPEEILGTWQHLSLAKMIKGSYSGLNTAAKLNSDVGVNVPPATGYSAGYWFFGRPAGQSLWSGTSNFGVSGRNALTAASVFNNRLFDGFLSPASAFQFDTKMDDGNPATGIVNVGNGHNMRTGCTLPAPASAWDGSIPTGFDFTSDRPNCTIFRWLDI